MTITFKPAKRENVPLLIGLDGASGSGKTFSALLLADGIRKAISNAKGREAKVFFIDSERGRGLHYADQFEFMHCEINPPFKPTTYSEAIKAAEREGADVIVIDSFSHEWEGEGGVREWAEQLEKGGNGQQGVKPPKNWMVPKQAHKKLVNEMLAARAHIIVCLRSEEKMKIEAVPQLNDDGSPKMWNGKPSTKMVITPAADIPVLERWVAICEKRFPFEITTSMLLTPEKPGVPIPRKLQEQHRPFFPSGEKISRESGVAIAEWAMGGAAKSPESSGSGDYSKELQAAESAANGGTKALQAFWQDTLTIEARLALKQHLDRLKQKAATHDPPAPKQEEAGDGYNGV